MFIYVKIISVFLSVPYYTIIQLNDSSSYLS